jgi:hypothetical protein
MSPDSSIIHFAYCIKVLWLCFTTGQDETPRSKRTGSRGRFIVIRVQLWGQWVQDKKYVGISGCGSLATLTSQYDNDCQKGVKSSALPFLGSLDT